MIFNNANNTARLEPIGKLAAKSNYFIGADRSKWRMGIPNYSRVCYAGIYPGVDLIFYGNRGHLEFDFVLSPGADPNRIALSFVGASPWVTRDGDLRIGSRSDNVMLHRPFIYQVESGRKHAVRGGFALLYDGRVGFRVAGYNRDVPLIVDPTLNYSTFLNGTNGWSDEWGIAVDSSGDAYVEGVTFSPNFPTTASAYQSTANAQVNGVAYLAKFNSTGTALLYSTYLGGTGGDYGTGIAIDSSGNAYLTGYTFSTDFPVKNGFQTINNNPYGGNAFIARIDTTQTGAASLVYSSYLGGGGNPSNPYPWNGDAGYAIAVDSSGRAYVTGGTTSDASVAAFPTTSSPYQSSLSSVNGNAFLTVVDTSQSGSPSLVYSTYLGGDGVGSFGDFGSGIAADGADDAYIVGQTTSNALGPFPTTSNAYQPSLNGTSSNAFLTEIATTKSGPQSLVYSTYFGGSSSSNPGDIAYAVALDSAGKVYVAGNAVSSDFPTTAGAFQTSNSANGKAFVAKFDLAQSGAGSLTYSTLLGGSNGPLGDTPSGIAVDGNGDAFIVGSASSTDFPITSNAVQLSLKSSGGWNAFLTELNPAGSDLLYSTYLGGSGYFGGAAEGVALDSLADAYIGGFTDSSDFPTTAGAFQTTSDGNLSAFAAEIDSPNGATVAVSATPTSATIAGGQSAVYTLSVMSQGSFTSPIGFGCKGLPEYATCAFSPASVPPDSRTTETTLTISTSGTEATLGAPDVPTDRGAETRTLGVSLGLVALASALVLCDAKRLPWKVRLVLAAALAISGAIGCAQNQLNQLTPSTPSGTSQVTVVAGGQTATGEAQYSTKIALTVR